MADDDMDAYTAAPLFESGTINEDYVQATIMVMVEPPSGESRPPGLRGRGSERCWKASCWI